MVRKIAAFVAGLMALGLVVTLLQRVSTAVYPLPPGLDPMDPANLEAFREHLAGMPPLAWAIAFLSELLGALCGALVAGKIAGGPARGLTGALVGLALVGSVANWVAFPHPMWFIIGQVLGYPLVLVGTWKVLEPGAAAGAVPEAG